MKYYLLISNDDYADEHDVPVIACFTEEEYKKWLDLKIYPNASLGNSGDGWMDEMKGKTGKIFINQKYVEKHIVDESFYKTFHKFKLADLSLGNLFDFDQYNYDEDDLEEDDEYWPEGSNEGD